MPTTMVMTTGGDERDETDGDPHLEAFFRVMLAVPLGGGGGRVLEAEVMSCSGGSACWARASRLDGRRERTWYRFAAPMQYVDEAPASFRSSATRPGAVDLITTAFHEVISRRRLITYLVRAEIKKQGTDTVLGNIWWILDPLLSMLVYVVVMTYIFARQTPDFPIFLLAAMIPFKWFTGTISVVGHLGDRPSGPLIKQIQFPKIVLPLTINGAELVNLGFGLIVLMGLLLIWPFLDGNAPGPHDHLSLMVLWIPVIAVVQFVFQLGSR